MEQKKISGLPHLYCAPLFGDRGEPFLWESNVAARNAIALRERTLHAAFLAPIDYARDGSLLHIVPRVAVSSRGGDGTVTLHFRTNLRDITSIAVDPSSSSEIVLARLVLAEQFDSTPVIIPMPGDLEHGLRKADAVLLVGDASLRATGSGGRVVDLVEEWNAMTGLSYVHGFWCAREHALSGNDVLALQEESAVGRARLPEIAAEAVEQRTLGSITIHDALVYLEEHSYDFPDEDQAAVREFQQFAFYHGILPDVPDLQFIVNDDDSPESPARDVTPPLIR